MKTKRMFVGTVGVLFMLILVGGTTSSKVMDQNTAEMLYEEAMLKKDGVGNLPAAIKLFQQILAEFSQNRKISGQAQLQIGLCYEKLGESEALKAYEKVISEYTDQSQVLKTAKERVAFLETKKSSPQRKGDEFSLKKVSIPWGEPSPDGKWVAYENDNKGLSLYEMSTGNEKVIVEIEKDQPRSVYLETPGDCWSPSGNQIAYMVWHTPDRLQDLHIIDRSGSNHRLLFSNPNRSVDGIAGWTPDEKYIVVSLWNKDRSVSFVKISISDGQMEELITSDNLDEYYLRLSPDGKYLAYNYVKEKYSGNSDIRLYSIDGSSQVDVVSHPANDKLIDWTPDGGHILFENDGAGDTGIWAQSIKNGKSIGEAKLVKIFSGRLMPMGFTNDGAFYFYESKGGEDVYTAQVDLETGKTLQNPRKVEAIYTGFTTDAFWSKDGKYLGYFVRTENDRYARDLNKLRIQAMEDGSKRDILFDFNVSSYIIPRWSSDGKSIFMNGRKDRKSNFYKLDVDSEKTEIVLENEVHEWSSDIRFTYKIGRNRSSDLSESQNWIVKINTKNGEKTELIRTNLGQTCSRPFLSPDEKWIGFKLYDYDEQYSTTYTKICVIPARGGEIKELYQTEKKTGSNLFWDPSSKGLLFLIAPDEDIAPIAQDCELWYMPSLEAQSPRKLDLEIYGITQLSFHPDGKTVTFTASEPTVTNIWIMENYLPKEKK